MSAGTYFCWSAAMSAIDLRGETLWQDYPGDVDNFVILSLMEERGHPYRHLPAYIDFLCEIPRSRHSDQGQSTFAGGSKVLLSSTLMSFMSISSRR